MLTDIMWSVNFLKMICPIGEIVLWSHSYSKRKPHNYNNLKRVFFWTVVRRRQPTKVWRCLRFWKRKENTGFYPCHLLYLWYNFARNSLVPIYFYGGFLNFKGMDNKRTLNWDKLDHQKGKPNEEVMSIFTGIFFFRQNIFKNTRDISLLFRSYFVRLLVVAKHFWDMCW